MVKLPVFKAAEVLLNTPVDRSFTYSIPEGMAISSGVRVKVDFAGRKIIGFVVKLHNEIPDSIELKNIIEEIEDMEG